MLNSDYSSPSLLSTVPVAADLLPDSVSECLPVIRVRPGSRLLDEGQQCRICLQDFSLGQRVRTLPCQHKVKVFTACCIIVYEV